MPKKEDLDWSSWKNKKGRFLCPYCGNDVGVYDSSKKSWRCAKCGASFIRPKKRAPGYAKVLTIVAGWVVAIAGIVFLIVSEPFWIGIAMIAAGVLISGLALALMARWH